jgi:hypothetical protein
MSHARVKSTRAAQRPIWRGLRCGAAVSALTEPQLDPGAAGGTPKQYNRLKSSHGVPLAERLRPRYTLPVRQRTAAISCDCSALQMC